MYAEIKIVLKNFGNSYESTQWRWLKKENEVINKRKAGIIGKFKNLSYFQRKIWKWILEFTCLGQNTEKYITFTIPIEKEVTIIDKNREEITKNIFYILQFIDSARFMVSSLSNLVNNLSEAQFSSIHKF